MRIRNNKQSLTAIALTVVLLICAPAYGQDAEDQKACSELGKLDNFLIIDGLRSRIQTEITQLNARKGQINDIKPQAERWQTELDATNRKIDTLQKKDPRNEQENQQLESLQESKASLEGLLQGKTKEDLANELKQIDNDLSWKEAQQKCITTKLQEYAATPEQTFKQNTSMLFALLIGMVILGFFTMAWIDESVRRAIFSGQTGLQFVTLFSIVIAIILFGITTILEGKELAALLGGLSGYILGRISLPAGGAAGSGNLADAVAKITISPTTINLSATNATGKLKVKAVDKSGNAITSLANEDFQWKSDNTAVATVDNSGTVQRVGAGTCNITATNGDVTSPASAVTSV